MKLSGRSVCSLIGPAVRVRLVLAGLMMLAGTVTVHAEWSMLNSGTSLDLHGVHAVDATTAFAVGDRGTIIKTVDGGNTWRKQSSKVRTRLNRVQFLDSNTGYVVGGVVLKTQNGGASWQQLNVPTDYQYFSLHFVNAELGFIGGSRSFLKTNDGGLSWSAMFIDDLTVTAIQFDANGVVGYASATDWGSAYLYKTVDGGNTWTRQLWYDGGMVQSLHFPADDATGYFANQNMYGLAAGIYKTTDGGANWQLTGVGPASDSPVVLHFADAQTGVAVGYRGTIYHTDNGGASWTEGWIGLEIRLNDLSIIDAGTGYVVGAGGFIAKTTDGGRPSIRAAFLHPVAVSSLYGFSQMVGCTLAYDCVNDQPDNAGRGAPYAPNMQDYVADSAGNRAMFKLDTGVIPSGQRVLGIRIYLATTGEGSPYVSFGYQRVGIDLQPVDSTSFLNLGYWYTGWSGWSWTGLNWTAADIDVLEVGVKPRDGDRLVANQVFVKVYYEPQP